MTKKDLESTWNDNNWEVYAKFISLIYYSKVFLSNIVLFLQILPRTALDLVIFEMVIQLSLMSSIQKKLYIIAIAATNYEHEKIRINVMMVNSKGCVRPVVSH